MSEHLQEVINNAIEELEILEQCFEQKSEPAAEKLGNPIVTEHPYTFVLDSNKVASPQKQVTSLLKPLPIQRERNIANSVLLDGHTIFLNSAEMLNKEDAVIDQGDEDSGMRNLSGQVLIVGDGMNDTDDTPGEILNNDDSGTVTVTGEDGVKHQIQFGLSSIEEEDVDDLEEESSDTVRPLKSTPCMDNVKTVGVNEAPEPVDESANKVTRRGADGGVETVFQCEICSKLFSTAASLTSHRWQHTKPFQCEKCKERFSSKGNLVIHRRRHTGDRPYECNICQARFTTRGNLKRHVQSHSGVKPWACTQCDGKFTEKKSLKIHMRKHTGERPYACKFCPKRFAQTSILKSHVAMHLDKRAHLCDLCGRGFRQKSQLRLHVLRHKGVKKFDCEFCSSKFITKADLERHVKSHMGTRDFACSVCPKTFTRQQTLNEHMNRHSGLKPFECNICGKAFSEMSTVYKHVKTHDVSKSEKQTREEIIIHQLPPNHIDAIVSSNIIDDVVINLDNKLSNVISIDRSEKSDFIYQSAIDCDETMKLDSKG